MQFIGRRKEMQRLEKLYFSQEAFVLLTGRKSVGKTTLARAFAQKKNVLYYSGGNVSDTLNRRAFYDALKEYCGGNTGLKEKTLPSWKEMLMAMTMVQRQERKLLIIDNFHYLAQSNPEVLSIFKNAWNGTLRSNYVMVVLIVPYGRMLMNLHEKGSGFLSVLTHRMHLDQISFLELMHEYPHHDFKQLMTLYSIVGGVPKYWGYFKDAIDKEEFISRISDFIINPYGDLLDEPIKLLESEVAAPAEYHSVLFALANHRQSVQEAAAFTGFKQNQTEEIIRNLIGLGVVKKVVSTVEHKGLLSKNVAEYQIKDPFMFFWYAFIFPFYEEIRDANDAMAVSHLKNDFDRYVQYWFRQVAREILTSASKKGTVPVKFNDIGPFFNKSISIDILGIDDANKKLFFGDCCYDQRPYDLKRFNAFVETCSDIRELKRYRDYDRVFGVFSAGPFEKDLIDCALVNREILLFNGINMYSMNL